MKGMKVDVRGLMKKRRITSGRAPSLTRRSSADHMHDEHDHDHDHGHDDKRSKKDIKKKQAMDNRKLVSDKAKLLNLPPNPPSMLSRKRSLSEQRKSLELNLLHRPDIHRQHDTTDTSMAHLHIDNGEGDADLLQEEQWASEAAVHGQTLTLPPQKDKNKARHTDRMDQRLQRGRDRKSLFDDRKNSVEGQTPGVGSSPTAELEKETSMADGDKARKMDEKTDRKIPKHVSEAGDQAGRGTPDSGIEDYTSNRGLHTPQTPKVKITGDFDHDVGTSTDGLHPVDDNYLSDKDKADAMRRPATSFTGLRRGTLEGEKLDADRPHTAHVRFKAEDLQSAFEEALKKYQSLPGAPSLVTAETLYKNDGLNFEDNWQERAIERHILLRMQKEIRAQSAAQRRQAYEMIQKDKHSSKHFPSRCDSAIGGFTDRDSSINTVQRANTSMSVPISIGYGVGTPPPTAPGGQRPKTANPVMEKQQTNKNDLSHEKAYRFKLNRNASRPTSSKSISTVADFSPHWIDPRNPDAWRPKSSRSIPSKCNRYILVNKPKEQQKKPVPSPLEEQLLYERFPKLGAKVVPGMQDLTPRTKRSYNLEYSPFVYQRYVK